MVEKMYGYLSCYFQRKPQSDKNIPITYRFCPLFLQGILTMFYIDGRHCKSCALLLYKYK